MGAINSLGIYILVVCLAGQRERIAWLGIHFVTDSIVTRYIPVVFFSRFFILACHNCHYISCTTLPLQRDGTERETVCVFGIRPCLFVETFVVDKLVCHVNKDVAIGLACGSINGIDILLRTEFVVFVSVINLVRRSIEPCVLYKVYKVVVGSDKRYHASFFTSVSVGIGLYSRTVHIDVCWQYHIAVGFA